MVVQAHVAHVMSHHFIPSCVMFTSLARAEGQEFHVAVRVCSHGLLSAVARCAARHRAPSTGHSFSCKAHPRSIRRNRRGLLNPTSSFYGDAQGSMTHRWKHRVGASEQFVRTKPTPAHVHACGSHFRPSCVSPVPSRDAACSSQTRTRTCGACDHRRPCFQLLVRPGQPQAGFP